MKNNKQYGIEKMAKIFKVSRSGYYKYDKKTISNREKNDIELSEKILTIFNNSRRVYGSPRIHMDLKKQGLKCSRRKVAKIMQENGLQAKMRKKWKPSKKNNATTNIAPNLLNQNFTVSDLNKVWVEDITTIYTKEGHLYVSTVLDLCSRRIVGLSMSNKSDSNLTLKSLEQARIHRKPAPGLILHSDRGTQYTSHQNKDYAEKNKFILSMSSKGNCFDNAAMESFFHTLKTEHTQFFKYKTRDEAKISIFEYIEIFYNRKRSHSTINFMAPSEFEKQTYEKQFYNS